MGEQLNLFPARAAIGQADASGKVYMTPEFSRALGQLLVRVGGPDGMSNDDLALEVQQSDAAVLARHQALLSELVLQVATLTSNLAAVDGMRKQLEALELAGVNVGAPTDWEHPGKIGAAKANSASFTSINRVAITSPATSATLALADQKTFTVSNTLTLAGTDAATLNIGAGGTLGTAAFAAASSFAGRTNTGVGPAATDAASTQNLANNLRTVLLSVGIGT